jgi:FdhD protein
MENERTAGGFAERRIARWVGSRAERRSDCIAEEVPVAMHYNGRSFAVMMATPQDLEDFAIGFSLSEGLVRSIDQLHGVDVHRRLEGIELAMTVSPEAPAARIERTAERLLPGRSGCGMCGMRELEEAVRQPAPLRCRGTFSAAALKRALRELPEHQPMNAATGAVHAAAWADAGGRILLAREDVGRHNALDKLIGAMWHARLAPEDGMLLITSRASYEMVGKAATVGIGCIAAISAPTTLALELARSAGVCLVAFARPEGFNVYTHEDRLQD